MEASSQLGEQSRHSGVETEFIQAISGGDLEKVKQLIHEDVDLDTAFEVALKNRHLQSFAICLRRNLTILLYISISLL